MEDDFLEALVASERIAEWVEAVKGSARATTSAPSGGNFLPVRSALRDFVRSVEESVVYAEEAVLANAGEEIEEALAGCEDGEILDLRRRLSSLLGSHGVKVAEGEVREYELRDQSKTKVKLYEVALTHGVGAKVWRAAEILCEEIALPDWSGLLQGKTVLELGAGCGLCGLYAAHGGAKRVVLTDFEDSLLDNLSKSGEINAGARIELRGYESPGEGGPWEEGELGSGKCVVQVAKLDWLDPAGSENSVAGGHHTLGEGETFEVILGSDLMYELEPSVALPGVIRRHLDRRGTCLLAMKRRYEDILQSFLEKARECELRVRIKQVANERAQEEGAKLFGGGHHVVMLIEHDENGSGEAPRAGFERA